MSKWIADIVVCLVFYFVYHKFYIKRCKEEWCREIAKKVAADMESKKKKKGKKNG